MDCKIFPDLNEKQIEKCNGCHYASHDKIAQIWCIKHKKWIRKNPLKRAILKSHYPKPTIASMIKDFTKAMARWVKAGLPIAAQAEYIKRRQICADCTEKNRCPICGCNLWAKTALATEKCPLGKW